MEGGPPLARVPSWRSTILRGIVVAEGAYPTRILVCRQV